MREVPALLPWHTQRSKEGRGRAGWTRQRKVRQNRLHPDPVHEEEAEPQVRTWTMCSLMSVSTEEGRVLGLMTGSQSTRGRTGTLCGPIVCV